MSDWTSTAPTEPGHYLTRWAKTKTNVNRVIVTRRGRGLSVHCPAYKDTAAMGSLKSGELEWRADKEPTL